MKCDQRRFILEDFEKILLHMLKVEVLEILFLLLFLFKKLTKLLCHGQYLVSKFFFSWYFFYMIYICKGEDSDGKKLWKYMQKM